MMAPLRLLPFVLATAALTGAALAAAPAPWLLDIRTRAESDALAAAAGTPQMTLSPDDLVTIKRKLDFGEARLTLQLGNLRRHIALAIGSARGAWGRASVEACFREKAIPWDGGAVSLAEAERLLAAEADGDRRRRLAAGADARLQMLLPTLQYAYLSESRFLGQLTGETVPGFRSRDEARLPALVDGARRVLYETEPAFLWLRDRVAEEHLKAGTVDGADVPRLLHTHGSDLPAARNREAVSALLADLGLPSILDRCTAAAGLVPTGSPLVEPVDPPKSARITLAALDGRAGIADLAQGLGHAATYLTVPAESPFEVRWLAAPSVRDAFGHLLSDVTGDGAWAKERLGFDAATLPAYLRAAAFARGLAARDAAAQVLVEEALGDPTSQALSAFATLHARARGAAVGDGEAGTFVEELRRGAPARFTAICLAARLDKSLASAYGDAWWKNATATRKLRDAMAQSGNEDVADLQNHFRAQREDARTFVESFLEQAKAAGWPGK